MIDIVERLRGEPRKDFCTHQSYVCVPGDCPCDADDMNEAANEIERLRAEVAWHEEENHRLRAALHKIAEWDLTGTAIAALREKK